MFAWDSLFLILVLFPLLTGGIWWNAPHVHVEYTEAGPALAALALWLLVRGGGERSLVMRAGTALWSRWAALLSARPAAGLLGAWLVAAGTWFTTSLLRHRALNSGLADLGIFTNAISNVARFGWPMSSLKNGMSLLTDHQIFLLYPLGWLFRLWPSPVFLLLMQGVLLTSGGIALYLLGRQRLGADHPVVPWLPFLFWLAGPLRSANRFDFHPEVFMLPLFLFAAYLLQEKSWPRRAGGIVLLVIALATKESAGPVACGIGLAWLFGAGPVATRSFTRPLGAAFLAVGAAAFWFDSRVVPALFGVPYAYSGLYDPLPSSLAGLALAPFTHPVVFFGRLFAWTRVKFFCGTLLPLGFLSLLTPASLAALPGFLMLFLTSGDHRLSLGYHYAIEPMTGLLVALPAALDSAIAQRYRPFLLPLLVVAGIASYGHSEPFFWRIYQTGPHEIWIRDEVLPHVPQNRSVVASYGFVPHLAVRRWVNQPLSLTDDSGSPVDCLLIDPRVNNSGMAEVDIENALKQAKSMGYVHELTCGSFQLLQRKDGPECLDVPPPLCPEQP